jgi:hypothetical protein
MFATKQKASDEKPLAAARVEAVKDYGYEVGCTTGPRTVEESKALASAIMDLRIHRDDADEAYGTNFIA